MMEIYDMVQYFSITYVLTCVYHDFQTGTTERNRDEEIIKLLQADTNNDADWTKLW